jgi:hypothetical protein
MLLPRRAKLKRLERLPDTQFFWASAGLARGGGFLKNRLALLG